MFADRRTVCLIISKRLDVACSPFMQMPTCLPWRQVSDKELYNRIVAGAPSSDAAGGGHKSFVADRAEMALQTAAKIGCRSQAEALAYLGRHFRVTLRNALDGDSDVQVRCQPGLRWFQTSFGVQ